VKSIDRVFENRVLRGIFEPKMDEVTGERRKFHNEELHNLYSSPDIIRQVKSRRMRWMWIGVDWILLAQDRDRWRAVVSAVMNLRVLAPRS
jgi:hypothetical protein